MGHLTAADKALDRGLSAADRGGHQHAKVYQGFLRGRIAFDLGDYPRAQASFEQALGVARRYSMTEAAPVLGAWKGRAEAYAGNGGSARATFEALEPSAERSFFLAEACHLDRDLAGALTRIREARTLLRPTRPFGCGERPDWDSGYTAVEDRALPVAGSPGVLGTQIEAFSAYLEGLAGRSAEALGQFQDILTRKSLLELDPASAQIYFWYYLSVPRHDSSQEAFRLTLLGRALKDVQVRSSRIEEPALRQDYLSKPHWNAQFSLEAKKLKLM